VQTNRHRPDHRSLGCYLATTSLDYREKYIRIARCVSPEMSEAAVRVRLENNADDGGL
jgi:hypothetical protein